MLILFLTFSLFSSIFSISSELCSSQALVFRGTDLIKNAKGQIVLVSFQPLQCPKCIKQLEKLAAAALTFHGVRFSVLAPHWENYVVIGKVQTEFPRVLIDKDVDSTYERLGIQEHEIALFDRCGRLAHVIPSIRSDLSQFDDTFDALKSAQTHAVCGWCSYGNSQDRPLSEKALPEINGGPIRVARNYGSSSIRGFEKVDVWLKAHTAGDYDRARKDEEKRRSLHSNPQPPTSPTYSQHRSSPITSYQFPQRTAQEYHQSSQQQPHQQQYQQQNPHYQPQHQQSQQNPPNRDRQTLQVTRQPPQTPINYRGTGYQNQQQQYQQRQGQQVQQQNPQSYQQVQQQYQPVQQYQQQQRQQQGQQQNSPQQIHQQQQYYQQQQQQQNSEAQRRDQERHDQWSQQQHRQYQQQRQDSPNPTSSANHPVKTTQMVKTTTTQPSKFIEEDYDYYLGANAASTTEAPVQTQIPRPSLQPWWSAPPPTIPMQQQISLLGEENIPCTAYTDDVCFHQQEKVGTAHISKCCSKRIYFTDLCVPGKCSNSTIQLCCMQKFLQSRYGCCNDESQSDANTPTDKFSRCCHDAFTVEDDCCPKYAAKTYWESAHELCFPNTKIHLEKVRMEVRFSEGVRVVDLSENRLWDHECPFGINRQQYAYVP